MKNWVAEGIAADVNDFTGHKSLACAFSGNSPLRLAGDPENRVNVGTTVSGGTTELSSM